VESVRSAHKPVVLERDNQEVAIVRPVVKRPKGRIRGRPVTEDDPLWKLMGIGESPEPTDVATNKHTYVAEAYSNLHQSE